jgi:hypothetical protein
MMTTVCSDRADALAHRRHTFQSDGRLYQQSVF